MKLGIQGRLFALSLGLIVITVTVLSVYVSAELRTAIEGRMVEDLEIRAKLVGKDIEAGKFRWRAESEDVHMNIEAALTRRVPAGVLGRIGGFSHATCLAAGIARGGGIVRVSLAYEEHRPCKHLCARRLDVGDEGSI